MKAGAPTTKGQRAMTFEAFDARVLALPAATFDVKFGDRRTYCVGGRMFAMAGAVGEPRPLFGFKASPMTFELLVEGGLARPMPYLQRARWVELLANDALGGDELIAYVGQAHALIAAKLTRAARATIGL